MSVPPRQSAVQEDCSARHSRWLSRILLPTIILAFAVRLMLVASHALDTPVYVVGDFATDYLPRARYLAEHGRFPSSEELELDFYLRPPGYSVLLAPAALLDLDDVQTAKFGRLINVASEASVVALLLLWIWRTSARPAVRVLLASFVIVQPFTMGFVLQPGPDTVLMALYACVAWLLLGSGPPSIFRALVLGGLMGAMVLLRAEMVLLVLVPLVLAVGRCARTTRPASVRTTGGFDTARPRSVAPTLLALLAPVLLAILAASSYGRYVQGSWNLWAGGQARFVDHPTVVWVRSWYGNEITKTNVAWYWYRGRHLSMDYVPPGAVRSAEEKAIVAQVLERGAEHGVVDHEIGAPLAVLATKNRIDRPFDWHVGIRLHHGYLMWKDSRVSEAWRGLFHGINWRVPGMVLAGLWMLLVLGILGFIGTLARDRGVGLVWIALCCGLPLLARSVLFAASVPMPESRYMLPAWPLLLMLVCVGVSALSSAGAGLARVLLIPSAPASVPARARD